MLCAIMQPSKISERRLSRKPRVDVHAIASHFRVADPVMAGVIERVGPFSLRPRRDRFRVLVGSILSQQISTAAARTIRTRLEAALAPEGVRPEALLRLSVDRLRLLGVSRQKASYLHDLAQKCDDGTVRLSTLGRLADQAIIDQLIQVKGIGRWSAQMFLIFGLGRLDVFPPDDLGIRSAIARLYGFDQLPKPSECLEIGGRWRPYASVGSWYCWRFLDQKP